MKTMVNLTKEMQKDCSRLYSNIAETPNQIQKKGVRRRKMMGGSQVRLSGPMGTKNISRDQYLVCKVGRQRKMMVG